LVPTLLRVKYHVVSMNHSNLAHDREGLQDLLNGRPFRQGWRFVSMAPALDDMLVVFEEDDPVFLSGPR
jgi:hypothetical protein